MDIVALVNDHLRQYPGMEPQDIIKLIYQNEFGGGHMIDSASNSLQRLQKECLALNNTNLTSEAIGENLIRVNLANLSSIELLTLNQIFVASSNLLSGNLVSFIEKLKLIKQACNNKDIDYDAKLFAAKLEEYEQLNFPPISHSDSYRQAYQPHYRVVDKRYFEYFDLIKKINEQLLNKDTLIIAVDGKCGAGKSFLGELLQSVYQANLFKMDDFFLRPFQRTKERLAKPGGNVDYERFKDTVIDSLIKKEKINYQRFDCSKMALANDIKIIPVNKINIIEGTYSLHPYFGKYYDFAIGLDIDESIQAARILNRNGQTMYEKFKNIWIPLENKYFAAYSIFDQVDYLYHVL